MAEFKASGSTGFWTMKILILYSDNNPSDYHRLLRPANYFPKEFEVNMVKQTDAAKDESIFECDIVFFSRIFLHPVDKLKKLQERYGFKIVVDFDDHYNLPVGRLRYKLWVEHNVKVRMVEACKAADLVMVTNEQLQAVYSEFNENVIVVPNGLDLSRINTQVDKSIDDKIRFGYAAGASHYSDFKMLDGLFKRLRSDSEFKNRASFTFCGYNAKIPETLKMESLCKIKDCYVRRDIMGVANYMEHFKTIDVSIAPLEDNYYNNCKSNLKFIETASARLPFICSEVLPYTQDIELKNNGIIFCKNTSEWYAAFKFFLKNPHLIEVFGHLNYEYALKKYNLLTINEGRLTAFRSLK